jgi:hypothetical protein
VTSLPSSKPRPEAVEPDPTIRALLAELIDYAGLFPPAGLGMVAAARAYERYRSEGHAWMLGAFVVPLARLRELVDAAPSRRWPVSVLLPSLDVLPTGFGELQVRALEVAPQEPDVIRAPGNRLDEGGTRGAQVFYEVPLDDRMEARLDAIVDVGAAAKVRTGGIAPEAFPSVGRLVHFLRACAERALAFKATAGLHHPVRGRYPLTYQRESSSCDMHGFLDLALVSELIRSGRVDDAEAARLLAGTSDHVVPGPTGLRWFGHELSTKDIRTLRRTFFLSFGSCSFEEPVADLMRLGLL